MARVAAARGGRRSGGLQIMYGVGGERRLAEYEVPWLRGFEGSKPVRIGNAAHEQLQLDVFGEVADALYQARRSASPPIAGRGRSRRRCSTVWSDAGTSPTTASGRCAGRAVTSRTPRSWPGSRSIARSSRSNDSAGGTSRSLADDPRRDPRGGLHARLRSAPADLHAELSGRGARCRTAAHSAGRVLFPPTIRGSSGRWRRSSTSCWTTASCFAIGPKTPRRRATACRRRRRLPPCSFWLADAYVQQGRRDDALRLFERLLALRNDVGLLSEEYDPRSRRLLGNFPQAFSHLSLVNTAHNLPLDPARPARHRADGDGAGRDFHERRQRRAVAIAYRHRRSVRS